MWKRHMWNRSHALYSLLSSKSSSHVISQCFRSKAALDALARASEEKVPNLVLYNYPSFTGAFAALFAHLYHSHLSSRLLILPFSAVELLRVEELKWEGLEMCYLLDFFGPKEFGVSLAKQICRVMVFDHRKSTLARIAERSLCPHNLVLNIDTERTSARSVFDYFSSRLTELKSSERKSQSLVNSKDEYRLKELLEYIEDGDLRRWVLPDIKAFNIGMKQELRKLNCVTNPYVFEQLLEMNATDVIAKGNFYICSHKDAANKLLGRTFRIQLGRGLYGECLGVRADGNSELSNEIGIELSKMSAAAGLRPIGAVVYMQRGNLKMCLRSTDGAADTSEVAKAYGGGGSSCSSSFIIRMDEYNQWISINSP